MFKGSTQYHGGPMLPEPALAQSRQRRVSIIAAARRRPLHQRALAWLTAPVLSVWSWLTSRIRRCEVDAPRIVSQRVQSKHCPGLWVEQRGSCARFEYGQAWELHSLEENGDLVDASDHGTIPERAREYIHSWLPLARQFFAQKKAAASTAAGSPQKEPTK